MSTGTADSGDTLLSTSISSLPLRQQGKVRDIYTFDEKHLLIVATDRISAYDVIMPNGIPGKGIILTQMSLAWFDFFADSVPNHLVSGEPEDVPGLNSDEKEQIRGRMMFVRTAERMDAECVVRGYLAGSGWKDYQKTGEVCGIALPGGMRESEKLEEPIFTPATKADSGHDENISFEEVVKIVGLNRAEEMRELSLMIYEKGRDFAAEKGIIIADTKFEFGIIDGEMRIIDEILSPDSSRFWPADIYEPGHSQPSFDKQFVRDYLETLDWDKTPPGPVLPDEIVSQTLAKYREAESRLTEKLG